MDLAFHCLTVDSLQHNYAPAVVINDMAISAGSAVINDNGGHFPIHSLSELKMNQAHYNGHM